VYSLEYTKIPKVLIKPHNERWRQEGYKGISKATMCPESFLTYFPQKRKVRLMRSPVCLSVCLSVRLDPPNNFWTNWQIFIKFSREVIAIEDDLDAVLFNPVPSTIPKWQTFKLLRWMQNLHQSTSEHEILYTDGSSKDEQLLMRPFFVKNKKYEHGGQLNVKIHSLFCGDNSWTVVLTQMNFGIVKDHGHTYKLYLNHYFVWRSF
jgi:hypothetical protein